MIHGEVVIRLRVSLIILPHSAVGGFAPRPRKLSAASSIIIVPISSMAVTRMGPMIFGKMCLKISLPELLPDEETSGVTAPSLRYQQLKEAILNQ